MELYHKKTNATNKSTNKLEDKNDENNYKPPKKYVKNQPLNDSQKITKNYKTINVQSNPKNDDLPKRRIKYVIQLGKNKDNQDVEEFIQRQDRSASPRRRGQGSGFPYPGENYRPTLNTQVIKSNLDSLYTTGNNSRYNTLNDFNSINPLKYNDINNLKKKNIKGRIKQNYNPRYNDVDDDFYNNSIQNYINIESSQNEFEISSINDDDRMPIKNARSPEPKLPFRIANILKSRYKDEERKLRYPQMRALNKDIRTIPKSGRQTIRYINPDDDVDDLIQNIEDLQSSNNNLKQQIRNLKIDNINKDKEINYLKDELDNMQKELDDKKVENEKEIEEIFKNNDEESIPKLKNAYFKLLQDYDNNINDYNTLKDDYNKMVDEYNNLKKEKNKILKEDYHNAKEEANKALDDLFLYLY